MKSSDVLDLHLTRLIGWFVQTLGRAFLVGGLVGLVIGGFGAAAGSTGTVFIGMALAPVVSAIYLATANAPMPIEVDEN